MATIQTKQLWELPEVLLFHICSYIVVPTQRVTFVCHHLALLNKASRKTLMEEESPLWYIILQQDYGISSSRGCQQQRSSKRLKKSQLQRVCAAHKLVHGNTEIAYYYLTELCAQKNNGLSRHKLCGLLDEWGPHLRINNLTKTGGIFLVEAVRARNVKERSILDCVKELVENRGALVDLATNEYKWSLTALSVASARAMSTVVQYLLKRSARVDLQSTGRFRLYSNNRKTITCQNATPLEFATKVCEAEIREGASIADVKDLNKVIRMLSQYSKKHPIDRKQN